MTEILFTEAQWRAALRVEELTEADYGRGPDRLQAAKRIYGPAFANGEYFMGQGVYSMDHRVMGPPEPFYTVYERVSYLVLCGTCPTKLEALQLARERLQLIPPEYFQRMYEKAKTDHNELVAADEARAAIIKAKQKPRKITKRARAVFEASEGKCHYCATPLTLDGKWHIEHKIPRALFGGSEQSNLVAACAPCNHKKRDKTDLEFIAAREAGQTTS